MRGIFAEIRRIEGFVIRDYPEADWALLAACTPVYVSVAQDAVVWMQLETWSEPFWYASVLRSIRENPRRLTFRTGLEALARLFQESPGVAPSGFLFHVSRCGSTLVSRCLSRLQDTLVISECPLLKELASRPDLLRQTMGALTQAGGRVVVKTVPESIEDRQLFRELYPAAGQIFLYREPSEVLASIVERPSLPEPETARLERLESYFQEGLRAAREGMILVNYSQLPAAIWNRIAPEFGCQPELETMLDETRYHSKNRQPYRQTACNPMPLPAGLQALYRELEDLRTC